MVHWPMDHFPAPLVTWYDELEFALMDYESAAKRFVVLHRESEIEWDPTWAPAPPSEDEDEFDWY